MAIDHRVWIGASQLFSWFAVLSFLGKNSHSATTSILNQPSMMNIKARFALTCPAMPSNSPGCRLTVKRIRYIELRRGSQMFRNKSAFSQPNLGRLCHGNGLRMEQ
jgi:hypothetical protein